MSDKTLGEVLHEAMQKSLSFNPGEFPWNRYGPAYTNQCEAIAKAVVDAYKSSCADLAQPVAPVEPVEKPCGYQYSPFNDGVWFHLDERDQVQFNGIYPIRPVYASAALAPQQNVSKYDAPAWLFQHDETGQTMFVDQFQIDNGFEKNNPRLRKIRPVFFHSSQPKALTDEEIAKSWRDNNRDLFATVRALLEGTKP